MARHDMTLTSSIMPSIPFCRCVWLPGIIRCYDRANALSKMIMSMSDGAIPLHHITSYHILSYHTTLCQNISYHITHLIFLTNTAILGIDIQDVWGGPDIPSAAGRDPLQHTAKEHRRALPSNHHTCQRHQHPPRREGSQEQGQPCWWWRLWRQRAVQTNKTCTSS